MRVVVVMANDFPEAVFASQESADAHIVLRKAQDAIEAAQLGRGKIHFHTHSFPVQP